jgi:NTE family protein
LGPGGEILGGALNLARHHGLAHGTVFRDWFAERIDNSTFGDIARAGRTLKVIATDITRGEMLVLPDALGEYRLPDESAPIDPDSFAVADAVRMSMSIPYFFQPIELVHHDTGVRSTIVDGGVLSNFPVWIFDVQDRDPHHPTFGFKLVGGRSAGSGLVGLMRALGWPAQMGVDIMLTATEAWDRYWVAHATYVRTCAISTGDIGVTDFALGDTQKRWLLGSGEQAAGAFLDAFDPSQYVNGYGRHLLSTPAGA